MTSRRVAAFAQTLAIASIFLLPGLQPGGPSQTHAAVALQEQEAVNVFDATGTGIGCQTGSRKFKGPREPRNPPWPPGAAPTPSPTPAPSVGPLADPSVDPAQIDPEAAGDATAVGSTMLLASTGIRVAQAEPTPAPDGAADADTIPDEATTPATTNKKRKSRFLPGIDVSHWQNREDKSDIDFERIREGGQGFVIIKATESTDHLDTWFDRNIATARSAGLAVGAYHAFDYTIDGKAQADHFIDRLEAENGLNGALPPAVDVECWSYRGASTHAIAAGRLRDFVDRVYERTARLPLLYTSARAWEQVVGNPDGFGRLPLWAVCWGCQSPPILADGWSDWVFWQTGSRRVPGRPNKVDGNVFNGKRKALNALKLRPFSIESGASVTGKQRVELDLGGRYARHLRLSSDGEQWSAWAPVGSTVRAELGPEEGEQTVFVQLRASPGVKSPVISDSITLDQTGPELGGVTVALREDSIGAGPASIPIAVRWSATDALAGLSDATVSVSCGEGQIQRTEAPGSAEPGESVAWEAGAALFPDADCVVTAIGKDGVGNSSRRSARGISASIIKARDGGATVAADQVGVIAQRGPDAGRAAVMLDGEAVGLVDLYAPVQGQPEVIFVAELQPGTEHQIVVEGTGTSDPAATGTTVSVDGFVTISGVNPAS